MPTAVAPSGSTGRLPINLARRITRTTTVDLSAAAPSYASDFGTICPIIGLGNGHALIAWCRDTSGGAGGTTWQTRTSDYGQTLEAPTELISSNLALPCGLMCCASETIIMIVEEQAGTPYIMRNLHNGDPALWDALTPLAFPAFGAWGLPNFCPVQLASGHLFMAWYGADSPALDATTYVRFTTSTDDGATWTEFGTPLRPADPTASYSETCPLLLDDGTLMLAIRYDFDAQLGETGELWTAFDATGLGTSFGTPALAIPKTGPQPAIIQTPEKDVWVMSRDHVNSEHGTAWQSLDRGRTWATRILYYPFEYQYGQWAYIGPANTPNALISVTGTLDHSGDFAGSGVILNGWSTQGG